MLPLSRTHLTSRALTLLCLTHMCQAVAPSLVEIGSFCYFAFLRNQSRTKSPDISSVLSRHPLTDVVITHPRPVIGP